jgi:hypothetical protein
MRIEAMKNRLIAAAMFLWEACPLPAFAVGIFVDWAGGPKTAVIIAGLITFIGDRSLMIWASERSGRSTYLSTVLRPR